MNQTLRETTWALVTAWVNNDVAAIHRLHQSGVPAQAIDTAELTACIINGIPEGRRVMNDMAMRTASVEANTAP